MASLAILSISGLLINILIGRFYGASILGYFNQVYAIYILGSQIAVGSVHLSLQKMIAASNKQKEINQIISSGLFLVLCFALVISVAMYFTRFFWSRLLGSSGIASGIAYITPGLLIFAINKSFLGILNGLRLMKAFAFFQSIRYILMLSFLIYGIHFQWSAVKLPLIFSLSEGVLFAILFIYTFKYFNFCLPSKWGGWLCKILSFSYKSLGGNILADVNTRVDILILGYFLSDQKVGVYSFAAILAEGFTQILVVLKNNINPVLAKLSSRAEVVQTKKIVMRGIKLTYKYAVLLGIISIVVYPLILQIFFKGSDFTQSWPIFIILMTGILLSSGYQPFQMLLAQAGFPQLYTLLIAIVFVINVILNLAFIPLWGIYGSAIATALSFIASVVALKILTKKAIKIKI